MALPVPKKDVWHVSTWWYCTEFKHSRPENDRQPCSTRSLQESLPADMVGSVPLACLADSTPLCVHPSRYPVLLRHAGLRKPTMQKVIAERLQVPGPCQKSGFARLSV